MMHGDTAKIKWILVVALRSLTLRFLKSVVIIINIFKNSLWKSSESPTATQRFFCCDMQSGVADRHHNDL